MKDNSSR